MEVTIGLRNDTLKMFQSVANFQKILIFLKEFYLYLILNRTTCFHKPVFIYIRLKNQINRGRVNT